MTGTATGVDQSSFFIDAARRLAEEEGCPADRLKFDETAAVRLHIAYNMLDSAIRGCVLQHCGETSPMLLS